MLQCATQLCYIYNELHILVLPEFAIQRERERKHVLLKCQQFGIWTVAVRYIVQQRHVNLLLLGHSILLLYCFNKGVITLILLKYFYVQLVRPIAILAHILKSN
jgi:hypothetical protein